MTLLIKCDRKEVFFTGYGKVLGHITGSYCLKKSLTSPLFCNVRNVEMYYQQFINLAQAICLQSCMRALRKGAYLDKTDSIGSYRNEDWIVQFSGNCRYEAVSQRNCSLEMSTYREAWSHGATMFPIPHWFQGRQLMSFVCGQNLRQSLFASTDSEDLCIALMNY